MQLREFQDVIARTYLERDAERGVAVTVAWLAEEVGELAQAVRKGTREEQVHELGDVLAWLASLANQLDIDSTKRSRTSSTAARSAARSPARARDAVAVQRAASSSAIWTALSAAPLRRLSFDTNSARPCSHRRVAADAADVARVLAGGLQRRRDVGRARRPARRRRISVASVGRDRALELGVDRQRVAGEHRHPHARARHRQVGDLEDLAALVAELLLLVGLVDAVVDERAGEREHVERDRPGELRRRRELDRVAVEGERRRRRRPTLRTCSSSSATPARPAPDTAW